MSVNIEQYQQISRELLAASVTLVAVSKTKPVEDIKALYRTKRLWRKLCARIG
jgi:PLP dependent protein